jgi:hypothetical protein
MNLLQFKLEKNIVELTFEIYWLLQKVNIMVGFE